MEYNNQLEIELLSLRQQLHNTQKELASISDYKKYLENRIGLLEAQRHTLHEKLTFCIGTLKKAKALLAKRKVEMQQIQGTNIALGTEKTHFETAYQDEKYAHEQTRIQLNEALERLRNPLQTPIYNPNDKEFAYKMLYAPENHKQDTPIQALQNDVALIEQMLYLDEGSSNKT
jgi:chromosome segregation ATPase